MGYPCVGETAQDGADVRLGSASRAAEKEPSEPLGALLGQGLKHLRLGRRVSDEPAVAPGDGPGNAIVLHGAQPVKVGHLPGPVLRDRRRDDTSPDSLRRGNVVAVELPAQLGQAPLDAGGAAGRFDTVQEA